MRSTLKYWRNRILIRDLRGYMTKNGFFYFLIAFTFSTVSILHLIAHFLSFDPEQLLSILGLTSAIMIVLTVIFAGLIVDFFRNRVKLLLISSALTTFGFFLVLVGTFFEILGVAIIIFNTGIFLVDLLTIVTHESNILNRGRIFGYLFFVSFGISSFLFFITGGILLATIIIEGFLFLGIFYISNKYSYIETKERLTSDKKLIELITRSYNILGYFTAFCALGYVLGNGFPDNIEARIEPVSFIVLFLLFFLIIGILLDNLGRKRSFAAGIIVISMLIIFKDIFRNYTLYNSVYFGIFFAVIFILLFTFTSDFSTERNSIKYRGRITSLFLLFVVIGFLVGILQKYFLIQIYLANPQLLYWIPIIIEGSSPFILIVILVWILPLPEILTTKEVDWAKSLRSLYIFNKNSVCLYPKNFMLNGNTDLPSEDLVTGGLSGILELITEITRERRNLRIIDKEGAKIYFSYGKYITTALISTKFLPILFKKLDLFTKAFEKQFEKQLENFKGNVTPFLENTDSLLTKYFK